MDLNELLNRTADHIVADGTHTEAVTLQAMASAAGEGNQGAAAALMDWNGSEMARLRAFGIVHGVLLRELPDDARARLLADLVGASSAPVSPAQPDLPSAERGRRPSHIGHPVHRSRLLPAERSRHHADDPRGVKVR